MTCAACQKAEVQPARTGVYDSSCLGCQARRLANSPAAYRALAGEPGDLQADIELIWKNNYQEGRSLVWAWIERIKKARPP